MSEEVLSILANVGLLSFLALSAYILLIGGEMSFGQQAFFGIGAYSAGLATVLGRMPLGLALLLAVLVGGAASGLLGLVTLRLRGLYFSMSTLAAAEAVRILLELFVYQVDVPANGSSGPSSPIGPAGTAGFGGIRYIFEQGIEQSAFVLLIYGLLLALLVLLWTFEHLHAGLALRVAGEDPELAEALGIDVERVKLTAAIASGAIAALGGGLYAHYNTFVEPQNFDVMLGIHSLSYALIGGLGTAVGPLLGVAMDVALLEGSRVFHGYRMIAFGGIVALLLVVRPRGLLDEKTVRGIKAWANRRVSRMAAGAGHERKTTKETS